MPRDTIPPATNRLGSAFSTSLAEARAQVASLGRKLVYRELFDRAILDAVDVGILIAGSDGIVTFANRAAVQLLGDQGRQPLGRVERLLGLEYTPDTLLGGESRRSMSYEHRTDAGKELDLELTLSRGSGPSDEGRGGYFFIFRDVAEEKQREAERRRFERLVAMGTMVAGFAHEVRNPLAAMRSLTEELGEELRDGGHKLPHVGLSGS